MSGIVGNGFMGKVGGGLPYTPPSEILSSIHSAWSIRKVVASYNGNCIRVRRENDNAEQDIGFDANGYLDTSSLLSFAVTQSCRIATWYDQSGNGYNLTSAGANQPLIVDTGTLELENALAAITFNKSGVNPRTLQDNGAGNIGRYNFLHDGSDSTIFSVLTWGNAAQSDPQTFDPFISTADFAASVGVIYFIDNRNSSGQDSALRLNLYYGPAFPYAVANTKQNAVISQEQFIFYGYTNADNVTLANRSFMAVNNQSVFNANSQSGTPSTANQTNALRLGRANSSISLRGSMQELIICNADESDNRIALRDNHNEYFSTY